MAAHAGNSWGSFCPNFPTGFNTESRKTLILKKEIDIECDNQQRLTLGTPTSQSAWILKVCSCSASEENIIKIGSGSPKELNPQTRVLDVWFSCNR
jgi:hypothetical protein